MVKHAFGHRNGEWVHVKDTGIGLTDVVCPGCSTPFVHKMRRRHLTHFFAHLQNNKSRACRYHPMTALHAVVTKALASLDAVMVPSVRGVLPVPKGGIRHGLELSMEPELRKVMSAQIDQASSPIRRRPDVEWNLEGGFRLLAEVVVTNDVSSRKYLELRGHSLPCVQVRPEPEWLQLSEAELRGRFRSKDTPLSWVSVKGWGPYEIEREKARATEIRKFSRDRKRVAAGSRHHIRLSRWQETGAAAFCPPWTHFQPDLYGPKFFPNSRSDPPSRTTMLAVRQDARTLLATGAGGELGRSYLTHLHNTLHERSETSLQRVLRMLRQTIKHSN